MALFEGVHKAGASVNTGYGGRGKPGGLGRKSY